MFIGHFGAGFALKPRAPAVSLGTLFFAAQFLDLLWPTLLLLGVEHAAIVPAAKGPPLEFTHYPVSHSLAMVLAWSALFALGYYALRRSGRGAWVCGIAVLSHWILDLIVHAPDLPLAPGGGPKYGLGLWNSLPGTLLVEGLIFAAGVLLYLRQTEAIDRIGRIGLWSLLVFLVGVHLANTFGEPPPSIAAVAWVGQAQWLLVLWAFWVDRHRRTRLTGAAAPAPM